MLCAIKSTKLLRLTTVQKCYFSEGKPQKSDQSPTTNTKSKDSSEDEADVYVLANNPNHVPKKKKR